MAAVADLVRIDGLPGWIVPILVLLLAPLAVLAVEMAATFHRMGSLLVATDCTTDAVSFPIGSWLARQGR